jgi:hypothetical protein
MRTGTDRRQPLLREQQVASLYGEETFRQIIFQSENMPLPVPLGFGCGWARGGDWLPARREHPVPHPTGLASALALPFAGYSSLGELKADLREVERRQLRAIAGGMGFSSLSALINEATVNGKRDANNWFNIPSLVTAAGAAYSLYLAARTPGGAGTIPTANVASTALSATSAGGFGQANAPGSNTKHIVSVSGFSTVAAGALLLADQTLIVQPILATTTAQTITGSPTRYQSNGQNGVLIAGYQGGVVDTGTAPTVTVTYTESTAGTTGHTTGGVTCITLTPIHRTFITSGAMFFPMAAGDVGVRRIETTTWSVARGQAGWFGLVYPYCWLPLGVANAIFGTDLINTQFNLVQVQDGAFITSFLQAATTSSGVIQGELIMVSGNS